MEINSYPSFIHSEPMNTQPDQTRNFYSSPRTQKKFFFRGAAPVFFFIAGFILAGQLTDSPLYRECLQDPTINNDYCAKKFLG
tara:strand:+ start:666 stop:914 length:249 start_codon:yes stop_codon:yes gene_type:complete